MKRWIAKQWIAFAEISGWTVPGWVRRLIPAEEFDERVLFERNLTDSLKADEPRDLPATAFLEQRIERSVVEPAGDTRPGPRWIDLLIPSSAFAMAVVVGFILLSRPDGKSEVGVQPEPPQVAIVEPEPEKESPSRAMTRIGKGLYTLEEGLIMKPLAAEQKRLTADVASALQFVSSSILPDAYADGINSRLDSLKKEAANSI